MKKIIDGRKYDTETAKEVGYWSNGLSWGDFSHVSETLFLKKTDEFFLYGEGGAMSEYAQYSGANSWGGGEMIRPMTVDQAKLWASRRLSVREYESIFGDVEE